MTDLEYMQYAFKGNASAAHMVLSIVKLVGVWDDLVDGDAEVTPDDINRAFWIALVELPQNTFYREHEADLHPIVMNGILGWLTANQMEGGDLHDRQLAHVLRYAIADISAMAACLIGGPEWAAHCGPELRRRGQKDRLEKFLQECEVKHGPAT